jgi:hypothetical protein
MSWLHHLQHWLAIHTGTVNEPGVYYGFWSGFGSDIGEYAIVLGLGAGLYHAFRRHNCHEPRCWRIGLHRVEGTPFIACRKHHPLLADTKLTKGHMTEAYRRTHPDFDKDLSQGADA